METVKCRMCQGNYIDEPKFKNGNHKHYVHHLGFCGKSCWDKLSIKGQSFACVYNDLYGDYMKKNNIKVCDHHLKK